MNRMGTKTSREVEGAGKKHGGVLERRGVGSHSVEVCWLCNGMNYDIIFQ